MFPRLSETFLIAQVITAIECGFDVKILLSDKSGVREKSFIQAIEKYNMEDKIIIEDYKIPKNAISRIMMSLFLIFKNIGDINKILNYIRIPGVSRLDRIFIFDFYKRLGDFDIIHVQYGTNTKPIDALKRIKLLTSKVIISFHGHDLHFPINQVITNLDYYVEIFKSSDLLIANTPYLKEKLVSLGATESKIEIIPVGVNKKFLRQETNKKLFGLNLITVGRLEVIKGQKLGVQCVKLLRQNGIDVHYTLVGTGSQENELKSQILALGMENHITMTGQKNQEEIIEILKRHDIFLMTSIEDEKLGKESQGLVTAEAQALGLPVVAFDSGGVKYTIVNGKTGYLIKEGDVKAMAEKIQYLFFHKKLLMQMSKNATIFINQNYSNEKIKTIWCRLYSSVLEKSSV